MHGTLNDNFEKLCRFEKVREGFVLGLTPLTHACTCCSCSGRAVAGFLEKVGRFEKGISRQSETSHSYELRDNRPPMAQVSPLFVDARRRVSHPCLQSGVGKGFVPPS